MLCHVRILYSIIAYKVYTVGHTTSTMTLYNVTSNGILNSYVCYTYYYFFSIRQYTMLSHSPTGGKKKIKNRPNRSFIIMLITADRFKTKIKAAAIFHAFPPNKKYPLFQSTRSAETHYVWVFFFISVILFFFHSTVATA